MKREFIKYYLFVIFCIFTLSYLYEFFLEDDLSLNLLFSEDTTHVMETMAERWEYVLTVTVFSALSLILPFLMLFRINTRYLESTKENLRLQIRLDEALTRLLSGFVSICCICKKVRVKDPGSNNEQWDDVDHYIKQRTDLQFSHGYCPGCASNVKSSLRHPDGT